MAFTDLMGLLRVRQWYKNLVVFLPLFFVGLVFVLNDFLLTLLGFLALCLFSSATYIINDMHDRKQDRLHPEKRLRPIAAGRVSLIAAAVIAGLLFLMALGIAYCLSITFMAVALVLFALSQLYTFWLKGEAFIDLLLLSTNFVLRAVSGAFIIDISIISISPWLVLCTFFLSLFLAAGKREGDVSIIEKDKAVAQRKSLQYYTPDITKTLTIISATLLIMSYSLYSFLSKYNYLLLTLPFALYVIFRYLWLIRSGSYIARHPEYAYKDWKLAAGVLLWLGGAFLIIYAAY
ncbi:MAG: UbiA family prenyltransferase [Nanoarchaeota archaeon]|nr:UbiA family prenyltransferase [Nanoarchaeota archaeon]